MFRMPDAPGFSPALILALPLTLAWAPLAAGSPAPTPLAIIPAVAAAPGVLEADDSAATEPAQPEDGIAASASADDYDSVEKAGEVASPAEFRADGWIGHFQDGYLFGQVGGTVLLRMRHGRKAVPGSDYVVFRDDGEVGGQNGGATVGVLLQNVGVLRVLRVDRDGVSARVVKQYANMLRGDGVRLRETQRLKYYALLDRKPSAAPKALKGQVVGVLPPTLFAVNGDIVYLDLGRSKGLVPGMRLTVLGDDEAGSFGSDDYDSKMPMKPIEPLEPKGDDLDTVAPTGGIATVEVVDTTAGACAARVLECVGDVRLGDHVRYP